MGLKTLVSEISRMLSDLPPVTVYESEMDPEEDLWSDIGRSAEDVTIRRDPDAAYVVEGPWIDALVGRVNFNDRESMMYFERSLTKFGIIDKLRDAGCEEGDLVRIQDIEFNFVD